MTKYLTNRNITSTELAGQLSAVLREVDQGASFTVTRHGKPIAVLGPVAAVFAQSGAALVAIEESVPYGAAVTTAPAVQPDTAMARLIGAGSTRAIMSVFLRDPAASFYQRQIARGADVGLRSAQIALDRLETLGLVESERDGNRRYYRAVRSERFEDLRELLSRELGIGEVIARRLSELDHPVSWAFVFGSAASGEDRLGSDIDLLVVTEASGDDLVAPIAEAQRELGREIDLVSYRPAEFERKRAVGNHFIDSVLAQPRFDVIGGPRDA